MSEGCGYVWCPRCMKAQPDGSFETWRSHCEADHPEVFALIDDTPPGWAAPLS